MRAVPAADDDERVLDAPTPSTLSFPPSSRDRAASDPADFAVGDVVAEKYEIVGVVGRGATGVTYSARRVGEGEGDATSSTPDLVALKVTRLRGPGGWKAFDMAAREAAALSSLDHPGIPAFIASFDLDTPTDALRILVQRLVVGRTLADVVAAGGRGSPAQVEALARSLLAVAAHLASRAPPVVHRDIKPSNIVLEGGAWGGAPFVVDFGGVQRVGGGAGGDGDALSDLLAAPPPPGTTIVGSAGYMAPETVWAATPASDVYSVGGCVLFALTGRAPNAFAGARLRVDTGRRVWGGGGVGRGGAARRGKRAHPADPCPPPPASPRRPPC